MKKTIRTILIGGIMLSLALASVSGAAAQGTPQVKITQVDNSKFPQVTVYISVTDAAGQPVGIDPSTIQIFENGEPMTTQPVGGGGQGGVGPLTTMLVMDVSGSMDKGGKIDGAKAAAKAYIDQMRSGDQAGLMIYNTRSTYVQELTQDHNVLKSAIDNIQTGGDTAMYDAVFAAEEILRDVQGRKAIIAVTDGLDNSSSRNEDDVVNAIGPSGLSISTIGLGDPSTSEQPGLDEAGLRSLAQRSGGGYSFAGDAASLSALFQMYGRELQSEYALTYTSPSTIRDGVNRNLTVSLGAAGVTVDSKYNPGGVLPEVPNQSWVLFGALLVGLLALLLIPMLLGGGSKLFGGLGGGKKRGRVKLSGGSAGSSAQATPSMARGRIKIK
jgi:VWFA-related protein